jgi:hypothetical protein
METECDLIVQAANIEMLGEFLLWEYEYDEYLDSLKEKCRKKQRTGVIHSLAAQIARMEGVRNTLHERFKPVGVEYGGTKGFTWRTIETAFRNRILTGAVVNSNYIEPRQFLEAIRNTVFERIHTVMAEHGSVKINTMFNGEFTAGDKTA